MSAGSRQFVVVGSLRVFVTKGDITQQQVDVIVNSSRSDLDLSRGRASKALLDAAGADIQEECKIDYPYGIQDGQIAITSGGLLSCGAIYHGALSKYTSPDDEQNLENIIQSSLDQAETDGYVTIAFPALGAGFLGYPPGRVAEILFSCIQQLKPQSLKEVRIVIFTSDHDNFKVFLREAKKYSGARTHTAALRVPQDCIKIGNVNVKVMVGELSKVKAGVIVCSGPSDLQLSNNGLSQSLSDVAGPKMQEELNQKYPNGIDYGTFAVSGGYNLKCRFVYHGALPKWTTNDPDPSDTMEDFVDSCLETANQHSTKTIAFPTLGVGSLSYPIEQSAKIMGECIRYFCTSTFQITIQTIIIVVYKGCRNYSDIQKEFIKELNGGSPLVAGGLSVLGATVLAPSQNIVSRQSYSRKFGNMTVTLLVGDMAEQQVDVIVNSIASDLTMSSGVAAAISAAAGPGLSDELEQNFPMGIKEGDIATTQGHDLQCNEVYNGYLSPWYSRRSTGAQPPDLVLGDFVFACLERANTSGYSSIAFPALGTGYHKFPVDAAAESMVASIFKFSSQRSQQTITDVRIVLYGGSSNLSTLEKEFKHEISQGNCSGIITPLIQSVRLGMTPVPSRGTKKYIQYRCGETIRSPPNWTKFTSKKTLKEWIQAANSGKIHFEEVDQTTRASIEKAFGNTLGNTLGNAQIVNIQRIENADLFLRYGEERQRLFRKVNSEGQFNPPERIQSSCGPVKVMGYLHPSMTNHTESEINEYYFFHATKPHLVDIICKQGLDPRIARVKGRLGTGVYGAEDACKSHQYADSDYRQCFPMFLVRMSLGDIYMTQADNDDLKRPPCKVCTTNVCINHQEIYDSVMANGGSFEHREFVIYDRHQSYPEYLIWYKA